MRGRQGSAPKSRLQLEVRSTVQHDKDISGLGKTAPSASTHVWHCRRPRNLEGMDRVSDVDTVLQAILPWHVSYSDVLKLETEETTI